MPVMEYDFYAQRFGTQDQLDLSWLSLKATSNLPILVKGVTWMRIQIDDQVVDQVGVVDSQPSKHSSAYCSGHEHIKGSGPVPLTGQV